MKNVKIILLILAVSLSIIGSSAFAQVGNDTEGKVVKTLPPPPEKDCPSDAACELWEGFKEKYGEPSIVGWNGRTGALRRFRGLNYDTGEGDVKSAEKAEQIAGKFIEDNKALWKVEIEDLQTRNIEYSNRTKRWIVDYQQHYQGVPVENSFVGVIITDDGKIYSAGSGFHPSISISTTPAISEGEAVDIAKSAADVSIITGHGNASLTVLPQESDGGFEYRLVWIVPIQGYSVSGIWNSYKVFVDAQSGDVIKKYSVMLSFAGGTGDIIRYNLGLLSVPAALVLLLVFIYWWRRRK